jgi:hypothetical protein
VRPRSFNPACLRELERQLFSLQGDESSNRFAQRLGISTAMWSRLKSGERQLGTRLAWRIVQVFPHLKVLVPDIPITPRVGLRVYSATFWDFVNENGPTPTHRPELGSCWEWTGTRLPYGYGLVAKRSKEAPDPYAHHFAWRSARGPIPSTAITRRVFVRVISGLGPLRITHRIASARDAAAARVETRT